MRPLEETPEFGVGNRKQKSNRIAAGDGDLKTSRKQAKSGVRVV